MVVLGEVPDAAEGTNGPVATDSVAVERAWGFIRGRRAPLMLGCVSRPKPDGWDRDIPKHRTEGPL